MLPPPQLAKAGAASTAAAGTTAAAAAAASSGPMPNPNNVGLLSRDAAVQAQKRGERPLALMARLYALGERGKRFAALLLIDEERLISLLRAPEPVLDRWFSTDDPLSYLDRLLRHTARSNGTRPQQQPQQQPAEQQQQEKMQLQQPTQQQTVKVPPVSWLQVQSAAPTHAEPWGEPTQAAAVTPPLMGGLPPGFTEAPVQQQAQPSSQDSYASASAAFQSQLASDAAGGGGALAQGGGGGDEAEDDDDFNSLLQLLGT